MGHLLVRLGFLVVALFITGCVAPQPMYEYTLARTALSSAKEAGAEHHASGLWYQAQDQFRRGEKSLRDKDNLSAQASFKKAVEIAERAENATRLKKFETGETF